MNDTLPLELTATQREPSSFEKIAASSLLADLDQSLNVGRAVVLVCKNDGWVLAGSTRVEFDDFWQDAPISLSVLNDVFVYGKDMIVIDADRNQQLQNRDSIFLGGMMNIACVGNSDNPGAAKVLLYVDNQVDNWAVREADLELMRKAVSRYYPEWSLD